MGSSRSGTGRLLWLAALVLALVATLGAVVATGYRMARDRLAAWREPDSASTANATRSEPVEARAEAARPVAPEAPAPTTPRVAAEAEPPVFAAVNTPPGPEQKAALAWLGVRRDAGEQDLTRRLDALGLTADLEHFQSAVARNDLEQVRLFLEAGLDPNTQPEGLGLSLFGLALLGLGGEASDDVVLVMAGAGANLEARTPTGLTPMMQAALHCRPRVVEGLLGKGAQRSARDNDGRTAADWARMMCPAVLPLLGSKAR